MFLNIKKSQITKDFPDKISINKREFWKYYLKMLEVERGNFVSNSEIEILSSLLIRDSVTSWFKKPYCEEIKKECNLKEANFRRVMYSLRDKGLIEKGNGAGDYLLCKPLINQRDQMNDVIRKDDEIIFIYPFKIEDNE